MAGIKKRPYPSLMAHPNNEHSAHKIIRPIRKLFPRYPLSLPFHRIFLGKTCTGGLSGRRPFRNLDLQLLNKSLYLDHSSRCCWWLTVFKWPAVYRISWLLTVRRVFLYQPCPCFSEKTCDSRPASTSALSRSPTARAIDRWVNFIIESKVFQGIHLFWIYSGYWYFIMISGQPSTVTFGPRPFRSNTVSREQLKQPPQPPGACVRNQNPRTPSLKICLKYSSGMRIVHLPTVCCLRRWISVRVKNRESWTVQKGFSVLLK